MRGYSLSNSESCNPSPALARLRLRSGTLSLKGERREAAHIASLASLAVLRYSNLMENTGLKKTLLPIASTTCSTPAPVRRLLHRLSDHRAGGPRRRRSAAVIAGVLDIVRSATGRRPREKWAKACMLSGECIKACDYGVNPRFLLAVARVGWPSTARAAGAAQAGRAELPQDGPGRQRAVAAAASDEALERLGQKPSTQPARRTNCRTWCSTPAATCSRRRTSRCSASTSWTRSASAIG